MKKHALLFLVILVASFLAGCFTLGPNGELQPEAVTLIGKFHEDAKAK